jgi:molybdopterin synthase catalytic subunit
MAERALARIADEVGARHGCRVAIVHRIGVLTPGDAAVVIACAAPHRGPAFRACEEALERLKHEVPIWKREVFTDGEAWVGMGP